MKSTTKLRRNWPRRRLAQRTHTCISNRTIILPGFQHTLCHCFLSPSPEPDWLFLRFTALHLAMHCSTCDGISLIPSISSSSLTTSSSTAVAFSLVFSCPSAALCLAVVRNHLAVGAARRSTDLLLCPISGHSPRKKRREEEFSGTAGLTAWAAARGTRVVARYRLHGSIRDEHKRTRRRRMRQDEAVSDGGL